MNSGDRGSNFILITRVHSTFYPHLLVFFIVLVNFVLLLWCFFVYVFLFGVFFLFLFFGGGEMHRPYRLAEVCGRFWVGNKRRKNNQNKTLKWRKGGHSSIVFSFVHSEWFSNDKMKLKSDIRIKILNPSRHSSTFNVESPLKVQLNRFSTYFQRVTFTPLKVQPCFKVESTLKFNSTTFQRVFNHIKTSMSLNFRWTFNSVDIST